jgi:predicted HTH domain antitoxin
MSFERALTKEMRLAAVAAWYEQGKLSREVAARIAGLNRTDFLLALARMGKDSFQIDFEDLNRELARG